MLTKNTTELSPNLSGFLLFSAPPALALSLMSLKADMEGPCFSVNNLLSPRTQVVLGRNSLLLLSLVSQMSQDNFVFGFLSTF